MLLKREDVLSRDKEHEAKNRSKMIEYALHSLKNPIPEKKIPELDAYSAFEIALLQGRLYLESTK